MEVFPHLPPKMGLDVAFMEECVAPEPNNKSDDFYYILLYSIWLYFPIFCFSMLRKQLQRNAQKFNHKTPPLPAPFQPFS